MITLALLLVAITLLLAIYYQVNLSSFLKRLHLFRAIDNSNDTITNSSTTITHNHNNNSIKNNNNHKNAKSKDCEVESKDFYSANKKPLKTLEDIPGPLTLPLFGTKWIFFSFIYGYTYTKLHKVYIGKLVLFFFFLHFMKI